MRRDRIGAACDSTSEQSLDYELSDERMAFMTQLHGTDLTTPICLHLLVCQLRMRLVLPWHIRWLHSSAGNSHNLDGWGYVVS